MVFPYSSFNRIEEDKKMRSYRLKIWFGVTLWCSAAFCITYEEAMTLYESRNYAGAVQAFEQFLQDNAGSALEEEAKYYLATSKAKSGDAPTGISALQGFLSEYPQSSFATKALYGLAFEYLRNGETATGVSKLEHLISQYPGTEAVELAAYDLGSCYELAGNLPTAQQKLESFLLQYPSSQFAPAAKYGLGFLRLRQNDPSGGIEYLERVIAEHPQSEFAEKASYDLGSFYEKKGDVRTAIARLESFIARYPQSSLLQSASYGLSHLYNLDGQPAQALASLDDLQELNPQPELAEPAAFMKASSYWQMGSWEEAVNQLKYFLLTYPESSIKPQALVLLGNSTMHLAQQLQSVNAEDPQAAVYSEEAENLLHSFLSLTQDATAALENFRLTETAGPIRLEVWYSLKDYENLIQEARNVAALEPLSNLHLAQAQLWLAIGCALKTPPDFTQAAESLDSLLASGNSMPANEACYLKAKAALWRSWVAQSQGDHATALQWYSYLRDEVPPSHVQGDCLAKLNAYLHVE